MPDLQTPPAAGGTLNADLRGVHYDLLKTRVPTWFSQGPAHRQMELGNYELHLPSWYRRAPPEQHAALSRSHLDFREALNQLETRLASFNDIFDFAEQPLKDAIKDQFNLDLDVRNVYFARKYAFKDRDDLYGFLVFDRTNDPSLNHEYRGISLLEAALANFEPNEEKPPRCSDCEIITGWGSYDGDIIVRYPTVRSEAIAIAPHAFAKLCRNLDLGKRYQQHIKDILQPSNPVARQSLEAQLEEHQRQHLAVSVDIARQQYALKPSSREIESGVSADVYSMLQQLLGNTGNILLDGRPVLVQALKVFDIGLVGPLLIGPTRFHAGKAQRLAVYLPNDPQQPLKEYASGAAFMADLRMRLHSAAYRRFFSRFIPVRQQGEFFRKFNNLYQPDGSDGQGDYPLRSSPAKLPLEDVTLNGDLWPQLRRASVDKIYADARAVAVPTGDEDRKARNERLSSYLDAVVSVFNLAAFVVPGLGPIMLAVGAAQMCREVFEGFEAFENGDTREMWAHFSSVALNVGFIGTGAYVLPRIQRSSVVDQLKPVTLANGERRLWKPDLAPYKADLELAQDAQPDGMGLFDHDGHKVLNLDGDVYRVKQDADNGDFRVQHPTRSQAYAPLLEHNGQGAWSHEAEEPQTWDGPTTLRRLGHDARSLTASRRQEAQIASGIGTDTLRAVHADQQPTPLLLADTLQRFRLHRELSTFIEQLGSPDRTVYAKAGLAAQLDLMSRRGLFGTQTLRVLGSSGDVLWDAPASATTTTPRMRVVLNQDQMARGEGLIEVLKALQRSDPELKELPGSASDTVIQRATRLRQYLAAQASDLKRILLEERYRAQNLDADPAVRRLLAQYPTLPVRIARVLLDSAGPLESETLPAALDEQARWVEQETRVSRAYEGLFFDDLASLDTQRLALHTLENLPGWQRGTRLELRQVAADGALLDAIGPPGAQAKRSLILTVDGQFDSPQGADFYSATWALLTPVERQALGFNGVGDLKHAIVHRPLSREPLREVLLEHPVRKPAYDTSMRLLGGGRGVPQLLAGTANALRTPQARVRRLFRTFSDEQVARFIESLGPDVRGELTRLEFEYATLKQQLKEWVRTSGRTSALSKINANDIALQIKRCWRRETGSELRLVPSQPHGLPALTADFRHVQTVVIRGVTWSPEADTLLNNFTALKSLTISRSNVRQLPEAVGAMRELTYLSMRENSLRLTVHSAANLAALERLEYVDLSHNNLGIAPDFSAMSELKHVDLKYTGIDQWPAGVHNQRNLQRLDLQFNQLRDVPSDTLEPAPEDYEHRVRINGVTLIAGNPFSPEAGQRVDDYWLRLSRERPELLNIGITDAFGVESPMIRQVRHMHPNMTFMAARELIWSLGEGAEAQLTGQVQAFDQLHAQLNAWAFSGGGARQRYIRHSQLQLNARTRDVRFIAKDRILRCWLRETPSLQAHDGTPIGLELDLSGLDLPSLPDLDADFSHVGSLKLSNMNLSTSPEGFLAKFRGVRWLDLSNNQLRELPPALEQMQGLTRLFLQKNQIRPSPQTSRILATRTTLRALWLDSNPLNVLPDFSAITDMRSLSLQSLGLDTWPTGLGEQPLLDLIDLRDNQFTEIPASLVAPPAEQLAHSARITNTVYLSGNPLSEVTLQQVRAYGERLREAGLSTVEAPNRLVASAGGRDHVRSVAFDATPFTRWSQGLGGDQLQARKLQWQALRGQAGADGFFQMLNDLPQAGAQHEDLQQRVWTVIDSITEHSAESEALRERMFEWAGRAACCDRAALSFSNAEVMAMVEKARAQASDQTQAGALIKLSRGLFRLDEVEKIALNDIAARTAAIYEQRNLSPVEQQDRLQRLEEVEIRLAYRVGLKGPERLDLPGQPSRTQFTALGQVTPAMLDAAQAKVLELNGTPEEFQALMSREFWQDFVTGKYRARFDALSKPYQEQLAALHDQVSAGSLGNDAYDTQARALQAQLAVEEAALIEALSRQELLEHPLT
ncbi:DUF6543 domain-containing protein [Pseudomonas sp. KBW05]|uniref:NEL-type E3 ubiquitin ligase domain-containing protein n=1 Tax=Pseudomonas sp. KBW05 TaxID=2153360 RepID=UPI00131525F2|nr:DUF6543 domain-containing protein [Pseudomonas sp. KBW05]